MTEAKPGAIIRAPHLPYITTFSLPFVILRGGGGIAIKLTGLFYGLY